MSRAHHPLHAGRQRHASCVEARGAPGRRSPGRCRARRRPPDRVQHASMPRTFRKVSCCPANEASGRSSAVALERTAKDASSSSAGELRRRPPGCRPRGRRGTAARPPTARICRPTAASARTSSVSRPRSCSAIALGQAGVADEPRKASAVVANPSGTRTPARPGWRSSRRARRSCRRPPRGRPGRARRTTGRVMSAGRVGVDVGAHGAGPSWAWLARCRSLLGGVPGRVCRMTVAISSTDLVEESIDRESGAARTSPRPGAARRALLREA